MTKPTIAAIEKLETIIRKLEAWQLRYGDRHDDRGFTRAAKSELIALVRKLESERGAP